MDEKGSSGVKDLRSVNSVDEIIAEDTELTILSIFVTGSDNDFEKFSVLLNIGSDTSSIHSKLSHLASNIHPDSLSFSKVGSSGFFSITGSFSLLLDDHIDVSLSVTDRIPYASTSSSEQIMGWV